jgi:RNA polymerase sigma factor (sigma-70 family)
VSDAPTTERLLEDAAWLKRLANTLAGNAFDADDLVQESRIAEWQQQPETDRSLRPWLAKVVRDVARMSRRGNRRRELREQAVVEERQPSQPDALLAQMRLHRLLVDLVLDLDEPYRSTIVARFVEGRSAASIARALGIPNSTVRARLREALTRLRCQLDKLNGDRKAWAPAVLAFAKQGMQVAKPTKLIMTIGALLVLLLGVVAVFAITFGERSTKQGTPAGASPASLRVPRIDREIDSVIAIARARPPGWIAQDGALPRHVAGRVVADGEPAAGALVRLTSDASDAGLAPVSEQRTGPDGRFDFGARVATEYVVGAALPGKLAAIQHVDVRNVHVASDVLVLRLDACRFSLYGTVTDSSGTPIQHAQLLREDVVGTETDAAGTYELCILRSALVGKEHHVTVRASGFAAIDAQAAVPGRVHHDFILSPDAAVTGRAITTSGTPVANAQIVIAPDEAVSRPGLDLMAPATGITDKDGRFHLSGVSPGRHRVTGRARGMSVVPMTVAVGSGDSTDIVVTLAATGVVRGHVVLDGKPVAGATIAFTNDGPTAVSQPDGSFVLDDVPAGETHFTASPYSVRSPTTTQVHSGEDNTITLEVESLGTVSGRVNRHGSPVVGARVMMTLESSSAAYHACYTDDVGRFSLTGVEPGHYNVLADDFEVGAYADDADFTLALGEQRVLDIDLKSGARISGIVVDAAGAPAPGVVVRFERPSAERMQSKRWYDHGRCITGLDGHFDCAGMGGGGAYEPEVYLVENGQPPLPFVGMTPAAITLKDGDAHADGVRFVVELSRLTIRGVVVDSTGTPVAEARISASAEHAGNRALLPAVVSNGSGVFEVHDLAPGPYALMVSGADGAKASASADAGATDVKITLDAATCEPGDASHTVPANIQTTPSHPVIWDDRIQLLGWDIPKSVHLGETFSITVYYKVLQPVSLAWKAFVHIDLADGSARRNADHDPIGGRCPTTAWRAGDVLVDRVTTSMTINAYGSGGALGPGNYVVWIGFFRGWVGSWQNMPISDAPADMRDAESRARLSVLIVE